MSLYPHKNDQKMLDKLTIGVVKLDIYDIHVPVFAEPEKCNEWLQYLGSPKLELHPGIFGYALEVTDPAGRMHLAAIIHKDADVNILAHEASHITDFVLEGIGSDTGMELTEPRAYLTGYIAGEFDRIIKEQKNSKKRSTK